VELLGQIPHQIIPMDLAVIESPITCFESRYHLKISSRTFP
jgi:hypothetical protein